MLQENSRQCGAFSDGERVHGLSISRIKLLAVDSWRTLFRFKSFFMLIFLIFWADRLLRPLIESRTAGLKAIDFSRMTADLSQQLFVNLPAMLEHLFANPRIFLALAALFLFKQVISLWPSNDMRYMHRRERKGFGLLGAMLALSWRQVAWDALALGTIFCVAGLWMLVAFIACRMLWMNNGASFWGWLFLLWSAMIVPLVFAGFSFSSKLAVIRHGGVKERLCLLLLIYGNYRMLVPVWSFFTLRLILEALFVAVIPGAILLTLNTPWLRVLLAGVLATPVYAFLKMISFKFFLYAYSRFDLIRKEYDAYFGNGFRLQGR